MLGYWFLGYFFEDRLHEINTRTSDKYSFSQWNDNWQLPRNSWQLFVIELFALLKIKVSNIGGLITFSFVQRIVISREIYFVR